jgi:hypothetical protein
VVLAQQTLASLYNPIIIAVEMLSGITKNLGISFIDQK